MPFTSLEIALRLPSQPPIKETFEMIPLFKSNVIEIEQTPLGLNV
jgi:hypothetical protein